MGRDEASRRVGVPHRVCVVEKALAEGYRALHLAERSAELGIALMGRVRDRSAPNQRRIECSLLVSEVAGELILAKLEGQLCAKVGIEAP